MTSRGVVNTRIALKVNDVKLDYMTPVLHHPTFKKRLQSLFKKENFNKRIQALKGVSLQVEYGEVLGVIGSNGSGKSSLMRVIGGIIPPTSGEVGVNGRVETLLALGVGFNRELSGRENIFLGGLASGMSKKDIEGKIEQIIEFSELKEFIDMPMRTYSSGMASRLGFSLALSVEPDILLIDEALATGDAHFKEKSLNKVLSLKNENRALILVSHALATIEEIADRVLWLEKGEVRMIGEPKEVVKAYKEALKVGTSKVISEDL